MLARFITITFFFSAILIFNGCATVFGSSMEEVSFTSNPEGAKIYLSGSLVGITPLRKKLPVKKEFNVEFKKDGFENHTEFLSHSLISGYVIFDVVGGLVPAAIDAYSGNWFSFDETNIHAEMIKKEANQGQ